MNKGQIILKKLINIGRYDYQSTKEETLQKCLSKNNYPRIYLRRIAANNKNQTTIRSEN